MCSSTAYLPSLGAQTSLISKGANSIQQKTLENGSFPHSAVSEGAPYSRSVAIPLGFFALGLAADLTTNKPLNCPVRTGSCIPGILTSSHSMVSRGTARSPCKALSVLLDGRQRHGPAPPPRTLSHVCFSPNSVLILGLVRRRARHERPSRL